MRHTAHKEPENFSLEGRPGVAKVTHTHNAQGVSIFRRQESVILIKSEENRTLHNQAENMRDLAGDETAIKTEIARHPGGKSVPISGVDRHSFKALNFAHIRILTQGMMYKA